MENFLSGGDESVVAVPTKSTSIDVFVCVLTIVRFVGSTVNIITISTHSFGVVLLVCMRAVGDLVYLFGLEDAVQCCRIKLLNGLVNHLIGLCQSPPISIVALNVLYDWTLLNVFSLGSSLSHINLIFLASLFKKLKGQFLLYLVMVAGEIEFRREIIVTGGNGFATQIKTGRLLALKLCLQDLCHRW